MVNTVAARARVRDDILRLVHRGLPVPEYSADLGLLLRALTSAMRKVLGCRKTYVALFAEAAGFEHVHFHVVPREPGLPEELRGPRVFGLLGGDPAHHVPGNVMDQVAASGGHALRLDS